MFAIVTMNDTWMTIVAKQVPGWVILLVIVFLFLKHLANNTRDWATMMHNVHKHHDDSTSDVARVITKNTAALEALKETVGENTELLRRADKILDRIERQNHD